VVTGIPFKVLAERADVELEEHQREARDEVLEYLGESAAVTPEEAEQIRREWREQRSTPGRSSRLSVEAGQCQKVWAVALAAEQLITVSSPEIIE
jgi:hypothetical protein